MAYIQPGIGIWDLCFWSTDGHLFPSFSLRLLRESAIGFNGCDTECKSDKCNKKTAHGSILSYSVPLRTIFWLTTNIWLTTCCWWSNAFWENNVFVYCISLPALQYVAVLRAILRGWTTREVLEGMGTVHSIAWHVSLAVYPTFIPPVCASPLTSRRMFLKRWMKNRNPLCPNPQLSGSARVFTSWFRIQRDYMDRICGA